MMKALVEPPSHYEAIHAAEAALARGDIIESRKLFKIAAICAASPESREHCLWRRTSTFPKWWEKPEWCYRAVSNVQMKYIGDRVLIIASIPDISICSAEWLRYQFGFDVDFYPVPALDDGEYDPEVFNPKIYIYGDTPLNARRNLKEVCDFLIDIAKHGKIGEFDLCPQFRPGDAYLLRYVNVDI